MYEQNKPMDAEFKAYLIKALSKTQEIPRAVLRKDIDETASYLSLLDICFRDEASEKPEILEEEVEEE